MADDRLPNDPRTLLIDIAARLTDSESRGGDTATGFETSGRTTDTSPRHLV
jgi:hypothetical protein